MTQIVEIRRNGEDDIGDEVVIDRATTRIPLLPWCPIKLELRDAMNRVVRALPVDSLESTHHFNVASAACGPADRVIYYRHTRKFFAGPIGAMHYCG